MHLLAEQKEGASGSNTPTESCFSLGTNSEFTDFSASSSNLRVLLPEKLQIVKPIEGKRMIFLLLTAEKRFHINLPTKLLLVCVQVDAICNKRKE